MEKSGFWYVKLYQVELTRSGEGCTQCRMYYVDYFIYQSSRHIVPYIMWYALNAVDLLSISSCIYEKRIRKNSLLIMCIMYFAQSHWSTFVAFINIFNINIFLDCQLNLSQRCLGRFLSRYIYLPLYSLYLRLSIQSLESRYQDLY